MADRTERRDRAEPNRWETTVMVTRWLRKHLRIYLRKKYLGKETVEPEKPQMPRLPLERARPLTSSTPSQSTSDFFQKLPPELRRAVLIEAFGDEILHMDLSFKRPRKRPTRENKASWKLARRLPHCAIFGDWYRGYELEPEWLLPERWEWFSCVCHRGAQMGYSCEPYNDGCLSGNAQCQRWPGKYVGKCFIGVLGWLSSCKQAYAEGIDVLYGTNTIHMASDVMLHNLPALILPQRLAMITSVEMVWALGQKRTGHALPPFQARQTLTDFIKSIETTLPNLSRLQIDLIRCYPGGRPGQSYNERSLHMEYHLLPQIDNMARRAMPRLKELILGIPKTCFQPRLEVAALQEQNSCYPIFERTRDRKWRVWRAVHTYPRTSLHGDSEGLGYWLRETEHDTHYLIPMCTMGEGGGPPQPQDHLAWSAPGIPEGLCLPGSSIFWAYGVPETDMLFVEGHPQLAA